MKPVVLITGCSHGLGLALAKKIVKLDQYRVIITARKASLSVLNENFKPSDSLLIKELDLNYPHTFSTLIKEIEDLWGGVDILINNAAVSYRAVLEHVRDPDEKLQMQTNYFAPRELIRLVLPNMKRKQKGKIINISSVGGIMAMPTMSSYSASKFALEGMSEALWYELKPFNISVSLIQLGFVNSNSFKKVITPPQSKIITEDDVYYLYYKSMEEFVSKAMGWSIATPDSISNVILKTMKSNNPPLRIKATLDAYFFSLLRQLLPQKIYHNLLYYCLPISIRRNIKKLINFLDN